VSVYGRSAAEYEWEQGANAISADQDTYLEQAAMDLTYGIKDDGGNTSGYPTAIAELNDLASMPETDAAAAQMADAQADINALDVFFDTPGLWD
jgi:hypothetical protein